MNPSVILAKDIDDCLIQGLSSQLHWYPEIKHPANLAVTLAAMANTDGGAVILGIVTRHPGGTATKDQQVEVRGLRNPQETVDRVFQSILLSDPPLVLPMPKIVKYGHMQVVVIMVPTGLPHVYSVDGRYYGRIGGRDEPLSPRRLRQLMVERGVVQFESQVPPGASLDDLDLDRVMAYLAELDSAGVAGTGYGEITSSQDLWQQALVQRGCLRRMDGQLLPTYAALLLFGRAPQQWLPSALILAARFSGEKFGDQFIKQEISGTLPQQLLQAESFLRTNMRSLVRMAGLAHKEEDEYPMEAVRELLVNAVAHRDYNAQGDMVHLYLFADRLEVHSPGGLPGPVNLENLLRARFARNAVITQVLADLGFVERLGYGLDRVVSAMQQHNLQPPKFEEIAGSFRVTLYNDMDIFGEGQTLPVWIAGRGLDLNSRQKKALGYLARQRRITNRDYQELCPDVHVETLRRDLAGLVSMGLIMKIGEKKATYYILKVEPGQEA